MKCEFEVVEGVSPDVQEKIQALFTPKRLAIAERGIREIREGKYHTLEEVAAYFAQKQKQPLA